MFLNGCSINKHVKNGLISVKLIDIANYVHYIKANINLI